PLIRLERMIVFAVEAFQAVLAVDGLLGADEAESGVAQRNAIIGMPSAQHCARHFTGHAANRGAPPDPARRWITDPGLAVGLEHVLDMNAADPVGEIVILRRRHRRRQMAEPELFQTRQKAFLLLAAEYPENEFRRIQRSAPRHHGENEPGKIGMIEIGDAAPFRPLRLMRAALTAFHLALPSLPGASRESQADAVGIIRISAV